jgi:predicted ATPase
VNDPKGSNWRKWDLHIHTPASFVQHYGTDSKETWDRFISDLERLPKEFKVIGINDYIFIEGYRRVLEYRDAGRLQNIDLILPVIELRVDKFGGADDELRRVNYHVIFSDEISPEIIQTQFLNGISTNYHLSPAHDGKQVYWDGMVTPESLTELGRKIAESVPPSEQAKFKNHAHVGFHNLNFRLETIRQRLASHYFEDKHLTAVGKAEWESIRWSGQSIADKRDIINSVNIVFTASQSPQAYYRALQKLKQQSVNGRLIDCSDAHYFSDSAKNDARIGNSFTWVKADPTFTGLKQALKEFDDRVFIGEIPDTVKAVKSHPTKYIRSIKIEKKASAKLDEVWFDGHREVELNPGLVIIMGNKGNAKSALTDVMGLLGGTKNHPYSSFLNSNKFCQASNNKAKSFRATLTWASGVTVTKSLDESVPGTEIEMVKYIPQNFFEVICNEVAMKEGGAFDEELEQVIFSHVDVADRLGKASLRELINHRTSEINFAIEQLKLELKDLNQEIYTLEISLYPEYRQTHEKELEAKKKELEAHWRAKPAEVPNPAESDQDQFRSVRSQLEELRSRIDELEKQIESKQKRQGELASAAIAIDKALNRLDNFQKYFQQQKKEFAGLEIDGIKFDELIKLEVNLKPLQERLTFIQAEKENTATLLDPNNPQSLLILKDSLVKESNALQEKLAEPDKVYQKYQRALKKWKAREKEIIGGPNSLGSVGFFERILEKLDEIPDELKKLRIRRTELALKIYANIQRLADTYRELYAPVQRFIEQDDLANRFSLNFDVSIVDMELKDRLFEWVKQDVTGSFCGVASGKKILGDLLARCDFNRKEDTASFLDEMVDHLTTDVRSNDSSEVKIDTLMRKGKTVESLYDYIFSLEFLEPHYVLKMGDKEMFQLSPGEKGALLLVFYLLVDKGDIPLIIDQPEENLDNQTIFDLLVPSIKRAKKRRQIIIVTHNPNIAIVCDAEQFIYSSIDKKNKQRVEYKSGSIESMEINKNALNVLEGTRPAFDNRSSKYLPDQA